MQSFYFCLWLVLQKLAVGCLRLLSIDLHGHIKTIPTGEISNEKASQITVLQMRLYLDQRSPDQTGRLAAAIKCASTSIGQTFGKLAHCASCQESDHHHLLTRVLPIAHNSESKMEVGGYESSSGKATGTQIR